jgi:hypothetical protein
MDIQVIRISHKKVSSKVEIVDILVFRKVIRIIHNLQETVEILARRK